MKNSIIMLFLFFSALYGNSIDKYFAQYPPNTHFIERWISPEGVRIGIRKVKNQPQASDIQIWKNAILKYLEERGYQILTVKKIENFEYIQTKVIIKERSFIYGIAFQLDFDNPEQIIVIEYEGQEKHIKRYESLIENYIKNYSQKHLTIHVIPLVK